MLAIRVAGVTALLLLALASAQANPEGKTLASPAVTNRTWVIAIGVQNYNTLPKLNYAALDARIIAQAFRANQTPKEQVLPLNDSPESENVPDQKTLYKKIQEHLIYPREGDTVVFFFSGHGHQGRDKKLYLMPSDGRRDMVERTGLPLELVREWLSKCNARHKIILLDACHSGAAGGRVDSELPRGRQLVDAFGHVEGSFIISSCQGEEKSTNYVNHENGVIKSGCGLFTFWLDKGLKGDADGNGDKDITVDELFDYVYCRMTDPKEPSGGLQTPTRRFEGGRAVVSVVRGRRANGVWYGNLANPEADYPMLSRVVLVIDQQTGNNISGSMYFSFRQEGYKIGMATDAVSGTWSDTVLVDAGGGRKRAVQEVSFTRGRETYRGTYDLDTKVLRLNHGHGNQRTSGRMPIDLVRDEARPGTIRPGASGDLVIWDNRDAITPHSHRAQVQITKSEIRRASGENHVIDFEGKILYANHAAKGLWYDFKGVVAGRHVMIRQEQAAGTPFLGVLDGNTLQGVVGYSGYRNFRMNFAGGPAATTTTQSFGQGRLLPGFQQPTPRPAPPPPPPQQKRPLININIRR